MAQTKEGAVIVAAQKVGVTPAEYIDKIKIGEKWCFRCRKWHPINDFGRDKHRFDGLASSCLIARKAIYNQTYQPIPPERRKPMGPAPYPCRNGDKKQARSKVNHAVQKGNIPKPNDLPCTDCGHIWTDGERRHEYDHARGYESESHFDIEPVCTLCHAKRRYK